MLSLTLTSNLHDFEASLWDGRGKCPPCMARAACGFTQIQGNDAAFRPH